MFYILGKICFTAFMTYKEAIKHYGSPAELARALGCTRQNVNYFKNKDRIPLVQQQILENITNGKLVADPLPIKEGVNKQ